MDFQEEIKEFLIESSENLALLDREFVQLERNPGDAKLISSAFRAIHTIKGTSGFFGFDLLGALTHVTESILSDVRDGKRQLGPGLTSLILEAVDQVKAILAVIERTGVEGEDLTTDLRLRLEQADRDKMYGSQPEHVPALGISVPIAQAELRSETKTDGEPGEELRAAAVVRKPMVEPALLEAAAEISDCPQQELSADTRSQLADSTIRVDVVLLNRLMNLVGELVLARNQLLQDAPAYGSTLQQTSQRLNLITSELQEGVMKTRMQPIGVVWNKLPRVVRDLASSCGKKIRLEMDGAGTELDKTIIEAIKDPLTHIVRNCCDHGIETPDQRIAHDKSAEGLIQLRAYHEGGIVNIEISDDGAGIDPQRVKKKAIEKGLIRPEDAAAMPTRDTIHLIFLPGFSTAAQVTSISGRGVGMDVVKDNIEKIGGNVEVLSRAEGGTIIRIKIPLTLAIIPGLVVTLNDADSSTANKESGSPTTYVGRRWREEERFIIPQANLVELVRVDPAEQAQRIRYVHGTPIFHHRGKLLPLVYLGSVLGRKDKDEPAHEVNIVVLQAESRKLGLVVDQICDTQEIVVKPLGRQLKTLTCYVGATIMGDGRPALILDVVGLARLAGLGPQTKPAVASEAVSVTEGEESQKLLLFSAEGFPRVAVPLALVDRLEEIPVSRIERAAGQYVLHYRDQILPLTMLHELLTPGSSSRPFTNETTHVIVFNIGARRIGLVVDRILDIVDEIVTVRRRANAPGLLGSAVVNGYITDLLDLEALLAASSVSWLESTPKSTTRPKRVLLVDDCLVTRELLRGTLEFAGFTTLHASTEPEALHILRQQPVDLIASSIELEGLLPALSADPRLRQIPVIGLEHAQPGQSAAAGPSQRDDYDRCVDSSNRDELLSAVMNLTAHHLPVPMEAA
jgi:two-component system chemotaxis sensor kinase CheA